MQYDMSHWSFGTGVTLHHTPSRPVLLLIPQPLPAAKLIPTQLSKNPANLQPISQISKGQGQETYLKKATREMDLSS